jgi:hypothetical protein
LPNLSSTALLVLLAVPARAQESDACRCHATNARYNVVNKPKTGYDYIPVVDDDSLGFYVAYSAKQNETNTGFTSTSCMYVLPLVGDEVLVFGGGFGDTWYVPGGAWFDADYDAAMIKQIIGGCMGRDPLATRVRFVGPHGHPDHITVAFVKALERAGLSVVEIAYHEGDRDWIEQLPWLAHHPALFHVLPGTPCGTSIPGISFASSLGRVWFLHRPGHTPGSIDLVLDVRGDIQDRVLILGSAPGGCTPPSGVSLTLAAHGTAMVGGPRRALSELLTGKGINRTCLTSVTPPRLGASWVIELDVSTHPRAELVYLFGTDCKLDPGELTPYGELLVDPLGRKRLSLTRPVYSLDKEYIGMDIPRDASLMGRETYLQAAIVGGKTELSNGLHLVIGF